MTLAEKMKSGRAQLCEIRRGCSIEREKAVANGFGTRADEVVVFRRNPDTGRYDMSTACCEAVLPPNS
jgi:hypothetical protein